MTRRTPPRGPRPGMRPAPRRVSDFYALGRTQPTLPFVDVDVAGDTLLFVDPRALRLLPTRWGRECVALIQDFFAAVLAAIRNHRQTDGRRYLLALREPNETHLGFSRGRARGRALGELSAGELWDALSRSQAVETGLLRDLEDTILMIPGISSDIISDITSNIIREPLIRYTQEIASRFQIPLVPDVDSGPLWDPQAREWYSRFEALPRTPNGKLLLVPKTIARRRLDYDDDEYFRDYILQHLKDVELDANTELVRILKKDGVTRYVTKKDLIRKYGRGKHVIVQETLRAPALLEHYRQDKDAHIAPPLSHEQLADQEGTPLPDYSVLLEAVTALQPGPRDADAYEDAIEALLSAILYPALSDPLPQKRIHGGLKRIDISYSNIAETGFFRWLSLHHRAPNIFVECKNYSSDPENPELDQLLGRFSPDRGEVGLLVTRQFHDRERFMRRCIASANDGRGYIIPLDDSDLVRVVAERNNPPEPLHFRLLRERFDRLVDE